MPQRRASVTGHHPGHRAHLHDLTHAAPWAPPVRVLPFEVGAFPGSGQSIDYAYGPVPQPDTVQLDQFHGPVLLDSDAHLDKYRRLLDTVEGVALPPGKSRDFIRDIADQL
ncbi:Scr1 family TA system antitoxin-like transcriptional regulator [Streptomyces flavidovirens]|uniref:Scr1 family TA system antitoxin-like transcriptional regulator n=1 Tax=Streptomyces flavidovirens TaxID=67298 RepID=UPI003681E428